MVDVEKQQVEKKKEATNPFYYVLIVVIVLVVVVVGYHALDKRGKLPAFLKDGKDGAGQTEFSSPEDLPEVKESAHDDEDAEKEDIVPEKDVTGTTGDDVPTPSDDGSPAPTTTTAEEDHFEPLDFGDDFKAYSVTGDSLLSKIGRFLEGVKQDPKILMGIMAPLTMFFPLIKSFLGGFPIFALAALAGAVLAFLAGEKISTEGQGESFWQKLKNADPLTILMLVAGVGLCLGAGGMLAAPMILPLLQPVLQLVSGLFGSAKAVMA